MKFIFPKNYAFKNKLFGVFDYSTIFLNIFWACFVFLLLQLFITNLNIKLFIFVILCFPILLFSISGFNGENIVYVFHYLIKFVLKQKVILFSKK